MRWDVTGDMTVTKIGISNYGSFEKTGSGVLRVTDLAANWGLYVDNGTLIINGSASVANNSGWSNGWRGGLTVAKDGILGGTGAITSVQSFGVTINGQLSPGDVDADGKSTIGKFTISTTNRTINFSGVAQPSDWAQAGPSDWGSNHLDLSGTDYPLLKPTGVSTLALDLRSDAEAGVTYDAFHVGGGTINIFDGALVNITAMSVDISGSYDIITFTNGAGVINFFDTPVYHFHNDGTTGYASVIVGGSASGIGYRTGFAIVGADQVYEDDGVTPIFGKYENNNYVYLFDYGAFGVTLDITAKETIVPEPASLGLLGLGAGLLMLRRKR